MRRHALGHVACIAIGVDRAAWIPLKMGANIAGATAEKSKTYFC